MSVSASFGPESLIQLGISLSDIALIYSGGRRLGNWLTAKRHDEDLFDSLMETPEVLLKRKGIVNPIRMESRFPDTEFIYQGERISYSQRKTKTKAQDLRPFSWLMVVIVAALDICLPQERVVQTLIEVFLHVLNNEEAEGSLRLNLGVNVASWRSVGIVNRVAPEAQGAYKKVWKELTGIEAIPQLNGAEVQEMITFLVCLLGDESRSFSCISATTFAVARSIERSGITIGTRGGRTFETQFIVSYVSDSATLALSGTERYHPDEYVDPLKLQRGITNRAQMVSYPMGAPEAMVQAVRASRETINRMKHMWELGARAADKMLLVAGADLPYSADQEFYYRLDDESESAIDGFDSYYSILASKAFPLSSQAILSALECLTEGQDTHRREWLEMHVSLDFLLRTESDLPSRRSENMALWLPYQSLVFGFYYKLLSPLVSLDFVFDKQTYFCGLWGYGSTTFLAMCTQFGQELRRTGKVRRTQLMYMLATMYTGRNKVFHATVSRINLVGVIGSISVLALPLLRTTDNPQDLAKFAVLDLPVVQLIPDEEGELFTGTGSGISFTHATPHPILGIRPHGPSKKWSVHSSMGRVFRGGGPGVVMAARCEGRLVGWFSPAVAETMFLSTVYCQRRHSDEADYVDETCVDGFEVKDTDWQEGTVQRVTDGNPGVAFGVVHSAGCPALRYAAAGFYGGAGEEVSIATDDIDVAFGRVELQETGVIIA